MYDEDVSMEQFGEDEEDEELGRFVGDRVGVKNDRGKVVKTQPTQPTHPKSNLPQQFHKAKRTINKLIHSFFLQLKSQYESSRSKLQKLNLNQKIKKNMVQFYLNKDKVANIMESIHEYVGIRYRYKSPMELKFGHLNQLSKKQVFQGRRGAVAYLAEAEKVVCLNTKGQTSEIKLSSKVKNFKLPHHATPVPLKDTIYLLDCSNFDSKLKTFLHDPSCYKITDRGQILTLPNQPTKPRIKCAITKLDNQILLLGGMIGPNKLPTTSCQKYNHRTELFTGMPSLNIRHVCPSACVLNGNVWVFSRNGIEQMDRGQLGWRIVQTPYNISILPYQFVSAYSNTQIMIFGGMGNKGKDIQIYDTVNNWVDVFEDILPGDVTSNRVSGPCGVDVGVGLISCVKAQSVPELKQKNNAIQVTYLTNNGIYLQNVGSFR